MSDVSKLKRLADSYQQNDNNIKKAEQIFKSYPENEKDSIRMDVDGNHSMIRIDIQTKEEYDIMKSTIGTILENRKKEMETQIKQVSDKIGEKPE